MGPRVWVAALEHPDRPYNARVVYQHVDGDERLGEERARSADCYVLCLYAETDRKASDVLDVGKWRFYVLSIERIDRDLGAQKRVGLGTIGSMTEPVGYVRLRERVDRVLGGAGRPDE